MCVRALASKTLHVNQSFVKGETGGCDVFQICASRVSEDVHERQIRALFVNCEVVGKNKKFSELM